MTRSNQRFRATRACLRITALVSFSLASVFAYEPPSERLPGGSLWSRGAVGVQGGIPSNWKTVTTVSPSDSGDDTAAINNAMYNARFTNSVVRLAAGTFHCSSEIHPAPGTILRGTLDGSGNRLTTIAATSNQSVINFTSGGARWQGVPAQGDTVSTVVTEDRPQGSTTLSFKALPRDVASSFNAGDFFWITEDNDADNFNLDPTQLVKFGREGGTPKSLGQVLKVASVTKGATNYDVAFTPALRSDYTTAKHAHIGFFWGGYGNFLRNCGVEDLIVTRQPKASSSLGGTCSIAANAAANCWLKNVESNDAPYGHVVLNYCKNIEIRHCYFHGGLQPTSGGGGFGYGILVSLYSSDSLFEDNILSGTNDPIMAPILLGLGAGGNVFSYNYIPRSAMIFTNLVEETSMHSAYTMFNLFEGNIGQKFYADNYHGGSRYQTLFRNWFKGTQTGATNAQTCITIDEENLSYSIIGNVLGSDGFAPIYSPGNAVPSGTTQYIYQLGFGSTGNRFRDFANDVTTDTRVAATTIVHGNWSAVNASGAPKAGQIWDPSIDDHALPQSYVYSAKPSFFGSMTWPPIDPASGIPANDEVIPAGYRFVHGADVSVTRPAAPKDFHVVTP